MFPEIYKGGRGYKQTIFWGEGGAYPPSPLKLCLWSNPMFRMFRILDQSIRP